MKKGGKRREAEFRWVSRERQQQYHRVSTRTGKMGRHFPVREKSGNFEQTGKVRENHTKYWKTEINWDKYYLIFLVIFKWTVHYLPKWIKFSVKKKNKTIKNTGKMATNTGKVGILSVRKSENPVSVEVALGSVKSLKYCYHLPTKLWEGNVLQSSVILSMMDMYAPPPILLASGQYASYCNAVLFKLGLNCEMYSWIVHLLNYFISISERCRNREARGRRGWESKVLFIYLFFCK